MREDLNVPVWNKYTLTVEEASKYFHIGESKLRRLIAEDPNANYLLHNGSRIQIKRNMFEHFIDEIDEV